jgi:hypothetical protein
VKVVVPAGTEISRSSVGWLKVIKPVPLAIARNRPSTDEHDGRQLYPSAAAGPVASRLSAEARMAKKKALHFSACIEFSPQNADQTHDSKTSPL